MPRQILEFRIVIASPAELYETRRAVFEVIHELNRTLEADGISIRGIGWEEYATPGIGAEVQEVVSHQLLQDYDILIALFATRLGTPTENHLSGTVEEIEHAIANASNPMGRFRVQVYFRDRIESVASISIDEFAKLVAFRKGLEPRGVLYRLFKDDGELQKEIRVNIQRPIREYLRTRAPSDLTLHTIPDVPTAPLTPDNPTIPELAQVAEPGILDQAEEVERSIGQASKSIDRIAELMGEIAAETNRQVAEIEKQLISQASAVEKKSFINRFADFLKSKAIALEQEARTARSNFNSFASSIVVLALAQKENQIPEQYNNELAGFLGVAETLLSTLAENRTSIAVFKSTVADIPRITAQFDGAKKQLLDAIDTCQAFFDDVERGIFEITAKT